VLWLDRRGDGAEHLTVVRTPAGFRATGVVLRAFEGLPLEVRYTVSADAGWRTTALDLSAQAPSGQLTFDLDVDGGAHWRQSGIPLRWLDGCLDVDLSFTPVTTTVAINRLGLAVGEQALLTVAHVQFPRSEVEAATRSYERLAERRYRCVGDDLDAVVEVDELGLVVDYEGAWRAVARA